jgi:hypothetical protein
VKEVKKNRKRKKEIEKIKKKLFMVGIVNRHNSLFTIHIRRKKKIYFASSVRDEK